MFDEGQINFTRKQRERDGADFSERPALAATPGRERFVPDRRDFVAQPGVANLHEVGK
jgi:hypothetical protein